MVLAMKSDSMLVGTNASLEDEPDMLACLVVRGLVRGCGHVQEGPLLPLLTGRRPKLLSPWLTPRTSIASILSK